MNERTIQLLGEEKFNKITQSNILVVGLGGVGAYAAEMIARAGCGRMTIVDADTVNPSNINRQLIALQSTIGKSKADILASRIKDINPAIGLTVISQYIKDEKTAELLDREKFDYVVDAIDTLSPKVNLIKESLDRHYPIVSSMGAGAKIDPTLIQVSDIGKTHHCPLAHALRKRLHRLGINKGFKAVFSPELPRQGAVIECEGEENKKSSVGTISYMPAVFGCAVASVVIRDLIDEL